MLRKDFFLVVGTLVSKGSQCLTGSLCVGSPYYSIHQIIVICAFDSTYTVRALKIAHSGALCTEKNFIARAGLYFEEL